jgi:hypothetical protein
VEYSDITFIIKYIIHCKLERGAWNPILLDSTPLTKRKCGGSPLSRYAGAGSSNAIHHALPIDTFGQDLIASERLPKYDRVSR